jgi:hypothetical protein
MDWKAEESHQLAGVGKDKEASLLYTVGPQTIL